MFLRLNRLVFARKRQDKILTDAIERVCEFDAMPDSWGLGTGFAESEA